MPNNKPNLGIVKEFIVKARIELYTGGAQDLESPEIITYHTLLISAVNKSQAEKKAKERAGVSKAVRAHQSNYYAK